eukprot:scaffold10897_cov102-Isochrysis_galbana.AAC.5
MSLGQLKLGTGLKGGAAAMCARWAPSLPQRLRGRADLRLDVLWLRGSRLAEHDEPERQLALECV